MTPPLSLEGRGRIGTDILSFHGEERSACSNRRLAGMPKECRRHGGYYRRGRTWGRSEAPVVTGVSPVPREECRRHGGYYRKREYRVCMGMKGTFEKSSVAPLSLEADLYPHLLHAQGGGIIFDDYRDPINCKVYMRFRCQSDETFPSTTPHCQGAHHWHGPSDHRVYREGVQTHLRREGTLVALWFR